MDQVQVDVIESSLPQRRVDRFLDPERVGTVVHKFRRKVDFGTRSVGLLDEIVDRFPAIGFVLIPFGSYIVETVGQ